MSMKGKKHTDEAKKKIGDASRGKKFTEETRMKISKALMGKAVGRKLSEEHKRKIGLYQKGKIRSAETRRKMSEAKKRYTPSIESIRKMSIALTGRKLSEETRRKMSESRTGEKSPHWKGGVSYEPYTFEFNPKLKKLIREKFNYTCVDCGNHATIVHHIDYDKKNNDEYNLIILCGKCHSKSNHHRLWNEKRFLEKIGLGTVILYKTESYVKANIYI